MKCEKAENYIIQLIYEELDPALTDELLDHLADCDSCSNMYVDLKEGTLILDGCFSDMDKQSMTEEELTAILAAAPEALEGDCPETGSLEPESLEGETPSNRPRRKSRRRSVRNTAHKAKPFYFKNSWRVAAVIAIFCGILTSLMLTQVFVLSHGGLSSPDAKYIVNRNSPMSEPPLVVETMCVAKMECEEGAENDIPFDDPVDDMPQIFSDHSPVDVSDAAPMTDDDSDMEQVLDIVKTNSPLMQFGALGGRQSAGRRHGLSSTKIGSTDGTHRTVTTEVDGVGGASGYMIIDQTGKLDADVAIPHYVDKEKKENDTLKDVKKMYAAKGEPGHSRGRVPVMGDLPIVGRVFKKDEKLAKKIAATAKSVDELTPKSKVHGCPTSELSKPAETKRKDDGALYWRTYVDEKRHKEFLAKREKANNSREVQRLKRLSYSELDVSRKDMREDYAKAQDKRAITKGDTLASITKSHKLTPEIKHEQRGAETETLKRVVGILGEKNVGITPDKIDGMTPQEQRTLVNKIAGIKANIDKIVILEQTIKDREDSINERAKGVAKKSKKSSDSLKLSDEKDLQRDALEKMAGILTTEYLGVKAESMKELSATDQKIILEKAVKIKADLDRIAILDETLDERALQSTTRSTSDVGDDLLAGKEDKKAQAVALREHRQWKRARESYESILLRDPANEEAIAGLENVYAKLREAAQKRRRASESERMAEVEWTWIDTIPPTEDAAAEKSKDPFANELIAKIGAAKKGAETSKAAEEDVYEEITETLKLEEPVEAQQEDPRESRFKKVPVNPFVMTKIDALSTFALDTDTASYTIARNYVNQGYLPPAGSVRTEEFVNAFDYNYPKKAGQVFTVHSEAAPSPFGKGLVLLKIGVRGKVIGRDGRKASHLVFAVDTSGSMERRDRMPLLKQGLNVLLNNLDTRDNVSLVTYGRESNLVLDNVSVSNAGIIRKAINTLQCGGSTNLSGGIHMAYTVARQNFRSGGINSVILCSDGMANIGVQKAESLTKTADVYRRQGISFNSVGFGMGNYNDTILETMANKGDGSYVFIDTAKESVKFFTDELGNRLNVIAKDAKIQVKFDPRRVRRYRLLGYENRDVKDKDFRNDSVDAGEVGSGQSATALYEIELVDDEKTLPMQDLGTVYVRYQNTATEKVEEIDSRLRSDLVRNRTVSDAPRFFLAAAVAEYAELMRQSDYAKDGSLASVRRLLEQVSVQLPLDARVSEFLAMVRKSQGLPRGK